jgi:hypothetical protein
MPSPSPVHQPRRNQKPCQPCGPIRSAENTMLRTTSAPELPKRVGVRRPRTPRPDIWGIRRMESPGYPVRRRTTRGRQPRAHLPVRPVNRFKHPRRVRGLQHRQGSSRQGQTPPTRPLRLPRHLGSGLTSSNWHDGAYVEVALGNSVYVVFRREGVHSGFAAGTVG